MNEVKTAFVAFFPVVPNNMGSSTVVNSRFKNWPSEKKLFQLSHLKKINNNKIKTILLKKERPTSKIFLLPKLILEIFLYLKNSKKKIIIIEGASWVFYSFIVFIAFKLILSETKIVYVSHSIESEIRKKYSNRIIYIVTFFLEKLLLKNVDLATSVSKQEKRKIKKLHNTDTILYPNSVTIDTRVGGKLIHADYIYYSGSYLYKPNKYAIDYLNQRIMPILFKEFPKLKLVITGGGFNMNYPWLINKDIVSKEKLYNIIYHSLCLCVPLKFGSGTRIKIIEALCLGTTVVSTHKGIEGIEIKKKNPPFIFDKEKEIIKTIKFIIKNKRIIKIKSLSQKKYYLSEFSMKSATERFLKKNFKYFFKHAKRKQRIKS